MKNVYAMIFM